MIQQSKGTPVYCLINVKVVEIVDVRLFPLQHYILCNRIEKLQVVRWRRHLVGSAECYDTIPGRRENVRIQTWPPTVEAAGVIQGKNENTTLVLVVEIDLPGRIRSQRNDEF